MELVIVQHFIFPNVFITVGAKLVGTGDRGPAVLAASVSLSTDGNTLAAGGPGDDMVRRTIAL